MARILTLTNRYQVPSLGGYEFVCRDAVSEPDPASFWPTFREHLFSERADLARLTRVFRPDDGGPAVVNGPHQMALS